MNTKILYAPLQGYTDAIYREEFNKTFGGIDCYITPFIRLEKNELRRHDIRELTNEAAKQLAASGLLSVQILPGDEMEFETLAAKIAELGYTRLNLNMGCPHSTIAKHERGAGLLNKPEKFAEIIEAANKHAELTISLKMRTGMEQPDECLALAESINNANLEFVAIHPRVGKLMYKGEASPADFDTIAQKLTKPTFYNGDICTIEAAEKIMQSRPNLTGLMIGRGLLQNPALALEIKSGQKMPNGQKSKLTMQLMNSLVDRYTEWLDGGEAQVLSKMQSYWDYLFPELDKKLRKKIMKSRNIDALRQSQNEAIASIAKLEDC